jgi:hypothetical protein
MSRQHVMMIAEPSATAFLLADDDRREVAGAKAPRGRSLRAGATSITTEAKVPAVARRVLRWAMKRAR